MAGIVSEKFSGRSINLELDKQHFEFEWTVFQCVDELDALSSLLAGTPTSWASGTLTRTAARVAEEVTMPASGTVGASIYKGIVTYDLPNWKPRETGEQVLAFDTTGGTSHITNSKLGSPVHSYPGTNAANTHGVIGQDGEGVDLVVPQFSFTATKYFSGATVTNSFIAGLYEITGKTNDAPWSPTIDGVTFSFDTGQVICDGAQGSKRGRGDWEITEKFRVGENRTDLVVGAITGIHKAAWEYLWVWYEERVSGTQKIRYPKYVYIEQVVDSADFSLTGL